jgi:hypothetical protein
MDEREMGEVADDLFAALCGTAADTRNPDADLGGYLVALWELMEPGRRPADGVTPEERRLLDELGGGWGDGG